MTIRKIFEKKDAAQKSESENIVETRNGSYIVLNRFDGAQNATAFVTMLSATPNLWDKQFDA